MFRSKRSPLLLAGLLATAGVAHFAAPRPFDAIVPRSLPGSPRTWTYASGVAELALAAGLALPRTRRVTARATAAFFVGVFPANLKMAVDWRDRPAPQRTAALARLPLQVPLVLWARGIAKDADGPA
ncbi:DoxX family protein [Streptomyces poonensis]|uniref:Membrane protein n=1 Tax=Streptomyces poonensis TaxID=68255 RepID=A0A918PCS9_9ACTN|nr:DoxX family protein [Streptomyces poonensis]GGZ00150.1 membrane protein [Streptomyces poonensis]GLJ92148.1 membrane protein [Streptomyces poonensis]